MGYIRRPSYYKDFRCIASDCTENCCIGWEIDVDEDTLAYYKSIGSDFSRRLCAAIAPADEQAGRMRTSFSMSASAARSSMTKTCARYI